LAAVQSMTAFARREASFPWGSLMWEIRSVNHRYLEIQFRLPDTLRHLESGFRDLLRERLGRGKVDSTLRLQIHDASATRLSLDRELLEKLHNACREIEALGELGRPSSIDLLRWPGVISEAEPDLEAIAVDSRALLESTIDELIAMRTREGGTLARFMRERLDAIATIVAQLEKRLPEILGAQRQKLLERCAELGVELDPERLEQEIVLIAQKSDVAEELARIRTHVEETRRTLDNGGACGRRLDFLMQEFNREANTLSSKSLSGDTTQSAVELKVLIEQMREQVQNIE